MSSRAELGPEQSPLTINPDFVQGAEFDPANWDGHNTEDDCVWNTDDIEEKQATSPREERQAKKKVQDWLTTHAFFGLPDTTRYFTAGQAVTPEDLPEGTIFRMQIELTTPEEGKRSEIHNHIGVVINSPATPKRNIAVHFRESVRVDNIFGRSIPILQSDLPWSIVLPIKPGEITHTKTRTDYREIQLKPLSRWE